jgi:hypothetical protein
MEPMIRRNQTVKDPRGFPNSLSLSQLLYVLPSSLKGAKRPFNLVVNEVNYSLVLDLDS